MKVKNKKQTFLGGRRSHPTNSSEQNALRKTSAQLKQKVNEIKK